MSIQFVLLAGVWLMPVSETAPPAGADPAAEPAGNAVGTGAVESAEPASLVTAEGPKLTVSAKDEAQLLVEPLTTAISTRDYAVGGTFTATTPAPGGGTFEVGYQIGCGIASGVNGAQLETPMIYRVHIFLFPGVVNIVPVTKKAFTGTTARVTITNYDININSCVGESFIRSYATLTSSGPDGDDVVTYTGVTNTI